MVKKIFDISFVGLKLGEHSFNYILDNNFFDFCNLHEILTGNVKVRLVLEKKERMLVLNFKLNGHVFLPCDLCLEEIDVLINNETMQIIKFSEKEIEEDNVSSIHPNQHMINVRHNIY